MVLEKNQALDNRIRLERKTSRKSNLQVLDDPLHDTKVVHHLHKGNEEDDGTQNASEKPALIDGVLVKEKDGTDSGFLQEVVCEGTDPPENCESSIGLEDEKGNGLLEKETNNDCLPVNEFNF